MSDILSYRKRRQGCCGLCSKSTQRLERHHISYRPEITIDICHTCHYRAHFQPNTLSNTQLYTLLRRIMNVKQEWDLLSLYCKRFNIKSMNTSRKVFLRQ